MKVIFRNQRGLCGDCQVIYGDNKFIDVDRRRGTINIPTTGSINHLVVEEFLVAVKLASDIAKGIIEVE